MANCKWWQVEEEFPAEGSCSNPLNKLPKLEQRRTGKEYPDVANKIMCKECRITPIFSLVLIGLLATLPLFVLTQMKSE